MRGILVTLLVSASVLCNTASAQSIAGEWNAEVRSPGGIGRPTIVFQVRGDTLTGTLRRPTGDTVPLQGSIKGDTVTFSYTIDYQGTPLDITVRAIVAGDSLAGSADFGGMASGSFNATRATPARPPGSDSGRMRAASTLRHRFPHSHSWSSRR